MASGESISQPSQQGAAQSLRGLADEFRLLASRQGIPEIIETPGDSLPQATVAHVVYDLGVALSLAIGDIAEAVEVEADRRDQPTTSTG